MSEQQTTPAKKGKNPRLIALSILTIIGSGIIGAILAAAYSLSTFWSIILIISFLVVGWILAVIAGSFYESESE